MRSNHGKGHNKGKKREDRMAVRKQKLSTSVDWTKYKRPDDEEITAAPYRVVAHYLDWAAKHHPAGYTPWNVVTRIATARSSTPRENTEEVRHMRTRATNVRRLLMEKYGREMENVPGVGVRATHDDLDIIKTRVTARQKRFEQAAAGLQATAALVNVSAIPNTAENKPIKEWFSGVVGPQLRKLESLQKALALPPALTEEKLDEGK